MDIFQKRFWLLNTIVHAVPCFNQFYYFCVVQNVNDGDDDDDSKYEQSQNVILVFNIANLWLIVLILIGLKDIVITVQTFKLDDFFTLIILLKTLLRVSFV